MRSVVKFHVEPFDKLRREFLDGWRYSVHVAMTYRTHHLLLGICKLTYVTSDARVVAGIF